MALSKAPKINGQMELTEEEIIQIRTKLEVIVAEFDPTDEQPVADTFYITATYNRENPTFPINGDTAQFVLAYVPEPIVEEVPTEEVPVTEEV